MERSARARRAALMIALAILGGCATIASHEEYAAYRRIRLASEPSERLQRLAEYARAYPHGLWIEEVRAERNRHEHEVWASNNSTREGLQYYLSIYPDGEFVELARQRLEVVNTVAERREIEQARVQEVREERREQAAVDRRLWVTRAVQFWTRTLLGIQNYGQPISQVARANPGFSEAFGQRPEPLCTPAACIKHYHAHYAIPVPGATRIEREIHLFLRIRLDRGRVDRIELLLPNKGFSRWYELENRTIVTDEDPSQRQAAIQWALQRIEPIIAEVAPTARAIDYLPDTIAPISAADQAQSRRAEESDGSDAPSRSGGATGGSGGATGGSGGATGGSGGATGGSGIDRLLEEAIGGSSGEAQPPPETPAPSGSEASLVLPIGLRALLLRNVRIVIFAASDEDYSEAYDGFYIERVHN
jgi:uncharacterized membrane protein YgcG